MLNLWLAFSMPLLLPEILTSYQLKPIRSPLKREYLGGDVEHTDLVKGLDYALLNNVRSEVVKKPEAKDVITDGTPKGSKEDRPVSFRTANAKAVYQWIVKPQTAVKQNDMFLPGRMAFIFDIESWFSHDIPTTFYRSKAGCPEPKEMVTVSVDGSNSYERKIQTSYRIVIRNAIQAIKNTIVRLWVVMMKMICPKWIWVDEQMGGFIGGTLRQKRNGQYTTGKKKQCPTLHFSLV